MEAVLVYTTTSSMDEARKIARHLLRRKLAACVSIIGGVESNFWWKGKLDRGKECILMVKTLKRHYPSVEKEIKKFTPTNSLKSSPSRQPPDTRITWRGWRKP